MASSAPTSGSSGAARKGSRRGGSRRPAVARPALAPRAGGGLHRDLGWVGVRELLWGGFAAEIRIPSSRSRVWIGRFDHALQAALAYDAAMFLFYGQKLPKLRRYNFPETPRPNVPEVVRKVLTVANVKAIAEKHGRSFGRFLPLPPPVIPAAPPAAAPPQMAEAGGAAAAAAAGAGVAHAAPLQVPLAAGAVLAAPLQVAEAAGAGGVAVDATPAGAGATAAAADRHGADEVYIDAEILTAADCQLPCNPDDDFIGLLDVDMDLIFSEI